MTETREERRAGIRRWLAEHGPAQLEMFDAAIRILEDPDFPGRTPLLGHAVRELRNSLPDLVGVPTVTPLQYRNKVDSLATTWERLAPPSIGLNNDEGLVPDAIELPAKLVRKVRALLLDHVGRSGTTGRTKAEQLFLALAPGDNPGVLGPVVEHWWRVTEFFMNYTHIPRRGPPRDFDTREVEEKFELFEAALAALIGGFYATMDEIDALLDEANS